MKKKLYFIFVISCKSLNSRSQVLGGLGPSEYWIPADGNQGESAARAAFTDPEQHAGAASKLESTPVSLLKKTSPCKKKTFSCLVFLTIATALSHLSQLCPSCVSNTWNISHFSRMEVPSPCLLVNFAADLSYTGYQTGNNHMASIMRQSALNILFDIHWDDMSSSLIASSSLVNTLPQIHASPALCGSVLYLLYDRWWLGNMWLLSICISIKTYYNLETYPSYLPNHPSWNPGLSKFC